MRRMAVDCIELKAHFHFRCRNTFRISYFFHFQFLFDIHASSSNEARQAGRARERFHVNVYLCNRQKRKIYELLSGAGDFHSCLRYNLKRESARRRLKCITNQTFLFFTECLVDT
jgi:hypothetical protein